MIRVLILQIFVVHITHQVASSPGDCLCQVESSDKSFPHDKLDAVEETALKCNQDVTPQKSQELDNLLLALNRRIPQLADSMSELEREDDGDLYSAVTLQVIENELTEILQLIDKLNSSSLASRHFSTQTAQQLRGIKEEMQQLEAFDTTQTVMRQKTNKRLKRDLDQCQNTNRQIPLPITARSACPHGHFQNVTGPNVYTAGEYPGSYKFGAWGQDPKPDVGKEKWYWLVMLTSSNIYANYIRRYSSLSALVVGLSVPGNVQIHTSNPTTNTIQGPNVVLYGEALYYNCYNHPALCRFNLTSKSVTSTELPISTRYNSKGNYCTLDACYPYSDIDLATDESGIWVVYTTSLDFGNLVLSQVEKGEQPALGRTWRTSLYKQAASNTFVACGVLYATRFVSKDTEEIFYSFDTATGAERFDLGIRFKKMEDNIYSLNYSPVDQMLHAYINSYMVSYKVEFQLS